MMILKLTFNNIFSYRNAAVVFLTLVSFLANGQKIDSLKLILVNQKGLALTNTLYQLAYEYIDVDNELAKEYAFKALNMAKAQGDSLLIVKSGRIGALALGRLDDQDSSIIVSLQILPIARRNSFEKELVQTLNRLGGGYAHQGKYDSSLIYHFESLSLREKNGNPFEISTALTNIGFVYFILQDYDKALSFFNRSLENVMKLEKKDGLDLLLLNMSACYIYKRQFDLAKKYIEQALAVCKDNCSTNIMMVARLHLGLIAAELKDYKAASKYFTESYQLAEQSNDLRYQLDNVANLLEVKQMTGDLRPDDKLLGQAESLLKEDRTSHRQATTNMYHVLFESYGLLRNFKKMSFYQNKYIQLRDSVYNEEATTNLMKVEADFMEKENKAKIDAQAKILTLTNEIIERQRTINIIIGMLAILFFGFVILLVETLKQKRRANVLLEQKVLERTMQLENQHNLLRKSLQEKEFAVDRMANDIKSSLATIKGLGSLVLCDVNLNNASTYVSKIEQTSNILLEGLKVTKSTNMES